MIVEVFVPLRSLYGDIRWSASYGAAAIRLTARGGFNCVLALRAGQVVDILLEESVTTPSMLISIAMPLSPRGVWVLHLVMNRFTLCTTKATKKHKGKRDITPFVFLSG